MPSRLERCGGGGERSRGGIIMDRSRLAVQSAQLSSFFSQKGNSRQHATSQLASDQLWHSLGGCVSGNSRMGMWDQVVFFFFFGVAQKQDFSTAASAVDKRAFPSMREPWKGALACAYRVTVTSSMHVRRATVVDVVDVGLISSVVETSDRIIGTRWSMAGEE